VTKRLLRFCVLVLISVGVVVGGVWLLAFAVNDREAKYDGKTVLDWAADLHNSDRAVASAARAAITNRVVPALRERMFNDTNDSQFKLDLADKLDRVPGLSIYAADSIGRRATAARGLGEFGPDAASAVPDLLRCAKSADISIRVAAIESLGDIHSAPATVIPVLTELLDESDDNIQVPAAESLGKYGAQAKSAIPKLLPLLKAHSKELPYATRKALEAIDPSTLSTNKQN
jgi:HEAT repeat protein